MRGNEIPYNCRICIIGVSLSKTPLVHCMAEVPVVMSVCLLPLLVSLHTSVITVCTCERVESACVYMYALRWKLFPLVIYSMCR